MMEAANNPGFAKMHGAGTILLRRILVIGEQETFFVMQQLG